jgi:pantetheine-phosphate adenylyltransferase
MDKHDVVVVGGTFDKFHKGHETLLKTAFKIGKRVLIGLSTDEFAKKVKPHEVDGYEQRMKTLEEFLAKEGLLKQAEIVPLNDPYGLTLSEGVDAIVVSKETLPRVEEINKLRREGGLQPLRVVAIDMVLAKDGSPVTASRIRAGEIDQEGNVIKR